jgi:acyl-CoA hydrolase
MAKRQSVPTEAKLPSKSPSESRVVMTEMVLPQHTNALGGIFGGVVMSWMDIAAAIAAGRHSGRVCVTASVDELHFLRPIRQGNVVNIEAVLTAVHRTSCEVKVEISAENPVSGDRFHTARAFLTFVAVDENGRPAVMPPLKTSAPSEKRLEKQAALRRDHRKRLKAALAEADGAADKEGV